ARVDGDILAALTRMVVSDGGVELTLDPAKLKVGVINSDDQAAPVTLRIPVILKTFGGAKQIVDGAGASVRPLGPDLTLQKAIARARRWADQLASGEMTSVAAIAQADDLHPAYVEKVLRLAWLAPDLTEAILGGARLRDFGLTDLIEAQVPADWDRQRRMMVLV
ncbi:MAG: hypothetical protein WC068_14470, partial [Caulobacter sp.]